MSAHPPPDADDARPAHDLEYDLAHDTSGHHRYPPCGPQRRHDRVQVATETLDYDGDYGYDLAHGIPRQTTRAERERDRRRH